MCRLQGPHAFNFCGFVLGAPQATHSWCKRGLQQNQHGTSTNWFATAPLNCSVFRFLIVCVTFLLFFPKCLASVPFHFRGLGVRLCSPKLPFVFAYHRNALHNGECIWCGRASEANCFATSQVDWRLQEKCLCEISGAGVTVALAEGACVWVIHGGAVASAFAEEAPAPIGFFTRASSKSVRKKRHLRVPHTNQSVAQKCQNMSLARVSTKSVVYECWDSTSSKSMPPGSKHLESYPLGNFQTGSEITLTTIVELWDLKILWFKNPCVNIILTSSC